MSGVTLVFVPTVVVLAETSLSTEGVNQMYYWLQRYAPDCLDDATEDADNPQAWFIKSLLPHDLTDQGRGLTDAELLVELAGRKCYNSFGLKAGRRSNADYIANLFGEPGKIPHSSVLYHAKITFFFAGIGRRVSHELIRHYVGADRDEEGSPSQESTRFTHHPGHFSVHPRIVHGNEQQVAVFRSAMESAYSAYLGYIESQVDEWKSVNGQEPKGMDRKRIYEAAAQLLPGAACTSFIWTTNPEALQKLFRERCDFAADLEIQRFATMLRDICYERWPNLFREANVAYLNKNSADQR